MRMVIGSDPETGWEMTTPTPLWKRMAKKYRDRIRIREVPEGLVDRYRRVEEEREAVFKELREIFNSDETHE